VEDLNRVSVSTSCAERSRIGNDVLKRLQNTHKTMEGKELKTAAEYVKVIETFVSMFIRKSFIIGCLTWFP
jgi:hypothetical protein